MSTPVLLDCDPGHDDAIAMLLALGSDELELRGVTTVAGNQTLEKTTANAIRVLELAGRGEISVAAGAWPRRFTARPDWTAPTCRRRRASPRRSTRSTSWPNGSKARRSSPPAR